MYLLGFDIGTSSVKCCLWTPDGEEVSSSVGEYALHHPRPGWSELNPDEIWSKVSEAIRYCIKPIDKKKIEAVSLSVIGHPIMPIDRKGKWLYPIIQYFDNRAMKKEAVELQKLIGTEKLLEATNNTRVEQPIANIIWMKRNMQEIFRKTWKFIGVHEYVLWKLCGSHWIDYSLAMRTSLFNRRKGSWDQEIFDTIDLDIDLMPPIAASGTEIGELISEGAKETGLTKGIKIVVGTHDAHGSPLGTGIIEEGLLMDETGTVEHIVAASPKDKATNFLCGKINKTKDIPIVSRGFRTSGSVLRWYRDVFAQEELMEAEKTGKDVYDLLTTRASKAKLGSDGLILLPDFVGDTTGGAFIGLKFNHGKNEMIRAIMEGITFEIRSCFEDLENMGVKAKEIRAVGGGAKSSFWLQLKANITKKKITTSKSTMPGTVGAAILAGIGIGEYKDAFDGVRRIYKKAATYTPKDEESRIYDKHYEIYKYLKATLKKAQEDYPR